MFKYKILPKSVQMEPSCFMRTDGRTNKTEPIVAFRSFAEASKNDLTGTKCGPNVWTGYVLLRLGPVSGT